MSRGGFIYWIRLAETRYVKIGKAQNVEHRLAKLQIGCPFQLHIMQTTWVEHMDSAEAQAHQLYKDYHLRGEWFLFPPGSFAADTTEALEAHKASRWADLKREIAVLRARIRDLDAQNTYLIQQLNHAYERQQSRA